MRRIDGTRDADRGPRPHPRRDRDPAAGGERLSRSTLGRRVIIKKTPEEIERMAAAGAILVKTMNLLAGKIRPGVTHARARPGGREVHPLAGRRAGVQGLPRLPGLDLHLAQLDDRARDPRALQARAAATSCRSTSAWSATAGWPTRPGRSRSGPITPIARKLLSDDRGVAVRWRSSSAGPGNRLGDVSHAVQEHVEAAGLSIVRTLVGHGIGRSMHEEPQIPNYGEPGHRRPARGGDGAGGRADGHRRAPRASGWARTTGRSTPRTARWRPISSSRSRSPPTGPGSSPRGTRPGKRPRGRGLSSGVAPAAHPAVAAADPC